MRALANNASLNLEPDQIFDDLAQAPESLELSSFFQDGI